MDIKASDIKLLREKTGAGMMDCKKALTEANGDTAGAEKLLKEWGLAGVEKRSGRATNEGRVFIHEAGPKAAMVEIDCETDFVSRNEGFLEAGKKIAAFAFDKKLNGTTPEIDAMVKDIASVIKENITLKRIAYVEGGSTELVSSYIHGDGKIGVLVHAKSDKADALSNEKVTTFLHDVALHIAAFNPAFLDETKISDAYKNEQNEIFQAQIAGDEKMAGKPAKVLEGIVSGKMKKHLAEVCLLNQGFVKDDKNSVAQVLQGLGKEIGANLSIVNYVYFKVGA